MLIDIEQWRAGIRSFSQMFLAVCTGKCRPLRIVNCRIIFLLCMLLLTHGGVKPKRRPKKKLANFFSCCYLNVNNNNNKT